MLSAGLVIGACFCAIQAIRSSRLLNSAIWLAAVSAFVSILLFNIGAYQVAVIELSVGAGLVTVLFVFAIAISGEIAVPSTPVVPQPLALGLAGLTLFALALLTLPASNGAVLPPAAGQLSFQTVFWQQRAPDALVQIVAIFAGALGVLGMLTTARQPAPTGANGSHIPEAPPLDHGDDDGLIEDIPADSELVVEERVP